MKSILLRIKGVLGYMSRKEMIEFDEQSIRFDELEHYHSIQKHIMPGSSLQS